jgi:hypothetical protein
MYVPLVTKGLNWSWSALRAEFGLGYS